MKRPVPVTFLPHDTTSWVEAGTTGLEAARAAGVSIPAHCGGRATCGSCAVRVVQGELAKMDQAESEGLAHAPDGVRLACRARVTGPVTVRAIIAEAEVQCAAALTPQGPLVAGVDLGTTNVSAVLLDPATGREVGRSTVVNRQRSWGADVISRITAALSGEAGELQAAAEVSILDALQAVAGEALPRVERVVIAGNSAMAALLTGADTTTLAHAPFVAPRLPSHPGVPRLRERIAPSAQVVVLDSIAAFVGGDVLAGLVALDVTRYRRPVLLVDIGTNAEVALWAEGRLTVASAPAGPAFEGVGLTAGGPAAPGAVVRVSLGDSADLTLQTIGGVAATSLCGAGFVSVLGVLRESGHLAADGAFVESGPLAERFRRDSDGVLGADLGSAGEPLVLTQLDVRTLQLAKAAVRVAVEGVLSAAEVTASALERVWVAGAFGGALSSRDLVMLGMLPQAAESAVQAPGNTSLLGAASLALDPDAVAGVSALTEDVTAVDLAGDPDFARHLMRAVEFSPFG